MPDPHFEHEMTTKTGKYWLWPPDAKGRDYRWISALSAIFPETMVHPVNWDRKARLTSGKCGRCPVDAREDTPAKEFMCRVVTLGRKVEPANGCDGRAADCSGLRMNVMHRKATIGDAHCLLELREQAIIVLAGRRMSAADAKRWADTLAIGGMKRKLHELDVWVAEIRGAVVGWGAIRGDCLEGLYADPEFADRGIGTALLHMLEGRMRERGHAVSHADASSNALQFYRRRGYELAGPRLPNGAQPVTKRLT
jgi:putative acetyltransferase